MAYQIPSKENWTGRVSNKALYLHEKVVCMPIPSLTKNQHTSIAILGYACDEGVKRNQGRVGAEKGPQAIRRQLAKMPNHLAAGTRFMDIGDVRCLDGDIEASQKVLAKSITQLLDYGIFPILLGGGHDIAYGHYLGIKNHLTSVQTKHRLGIINFDAHFDLRPNETGNNSGTPFYQIAKEQEFFKYLCLGIREDANDKLLFETAKKLKVDYVLRPSFSMVHIAEVKAGLDTWMDSVDKIYITIDMDGFSSAYAPGVSAPSPMGFDPETLTQCLKKILASKKVISVDIAEMNPVYDRDNQTAKLAASLVHQIVHTSF